MNSKNAIDFHNDRALEFDSRYALSKAFQERFHVWTGLFDRYVTPTDQVLDLGCGSGVFSHYLAEKGLRRDGHRRIGSDDYPVQTKKNLKNGAIRGRLTTPGNTGSFPNAGCGGHVEYP